MDAARLLSRRRGVRVSASWVYLSILLALSEASPLRSSKHSTSTSTHHEIHTTSSSVRTVISHAVPVSIFHPEQASSSHREPTPQPHIVGSTTSHAAPASRSHSVSISSSHPVHSSTSHLGSVFISHPVPVSIFRPEPASASHKASDTLSPSVPDSTSLLSAVLPLIANASDVVQLSTESPVSTTTEPEATESEAPVNLPWRLSAPTTGAGAAITSPPFPTISGSSLTSNLTCTTYTPHSKDGTVRTICGTHHGHNRTAWGTYFTPADGKGATAGDGMGGAIASILNHHNHHHHHTTTSDSGSGGDQTDTSSPWPSETGKAHHSGGGGGSNNGSPTSDSSPGSTITPAPSTSGPESPPEPSDGWHHASSLEPDQSWSESSSSSKPPEVHLLSLDGLTFTANTAGGYVMTDGQTLTPGGIVTLGGNSGNGEKVSLADGGSAAVVFYEGHTATASLADPTDPWTRGASLMMATGGPTLGAVLPTAVPGMGVKGVAVKERWVVVVVGVVVVVIGM